MQRAATGAAAAWSVALQPGVASLAMRLWADDNRGWRTADAAEPADGSESGRTVSGKAQVIAQGTGVSAARRPYTGLELTLRLAGRDTAMQKIFLLGAV